VLGFAGVFLRPVLIGKTVLPFMVPALCGPTGCTATGCVAVSSFWHTGTEISTDLLLFFGVRLLHDCSKRTKELVFDVD
jgi:hypothetical protein